MRESPRSPFHAWISDLRWSIVRDRRPLRKAHGTAGEPALPVARGRGPPDRRCGRELGAPVMTRKSLRTEESMGYHRGLLALCAVLLAVAGLSVSSAGAATCDDLAAVAFSHTTINAVQLVTSGSFDPPGPTPPVTTLPPFCRISLTVDPQITVEVWLPVNWNQRFQAVGGGGYAGVISWAALGAALRAGYATSSTDTGHDATVTPGGSFALEPNGRLNNGL